MLSEHLSRFHGGLVLRHHKKMSCEKALLQAGVPAELIISLRDSRGQIAMTEVGIGDHVLKGQVIAVPVNPFGSIIHAPTSGTVTDIADRLTASPDAQSASCVIITPDGKDQWLEGLKPDKPVNRADIITRIKQAGIIGLGGAGFPTHVKYQQNSSVDLNEEITLIINGAECEPYISCDERLMLDQPLAIIKGTQWLMKAAGANKAIIAIEDNIGGVKKLLSKEIKQLGIENLTVVKVPTIYPTGGEKQLIKVLTGLEVPSGQIPLSLGVVMQNVATAKAVYDAIELTQPLIERIVTVTGDSIAEPQNYTVMIGTPFKHLLQLAQCKEDVDKLVIGGPMMGYAMPNDEIGIEKTTNCLLALPKEATKPEIESMPCIRCGDCVTACPQELLPQQLFWYINGNDQTNDLEKAREHHVFDCIECGACSWVCPSHINLVDFYRFAKSELTYLDLKKLKSEQAKIRHEDREARLERIKAERQAKRHSKTAKLVDKTSAKQEISAVLERIKQQSKESADE
jgi:electron transport complex protein RnfC